MARDGSGVYSKPANTTAVTGQTITATLWNTMIDDLVADANLDRPVAAGGTGASSAADARTNLGAAADADVVKIAGTQTVAGAKTFADTLTAGSSAAGGFQMTRAGTGRVIFTPSGDNLIFSIDSGSGSTSVATVAEGGATTFASNDPQLTVITREKGDARYAPVPTTSTSANLTTYPIGERIAVAGLVANEPSRNEEKTIYIVTNGSETAAFTYENPSPTPASTLVGTWRSRGRCSSVDAGLAFYSFVRTA